MKALSIRQPWAWLICEGPKDIENRTWQTKYRGDFIVHASKTFDVESYKDLMEWVPGLPKSYEFKKGGIVGAATIVDCVDDHESSWFEGPWGFVLENRRSTAFVPWDGALNFFDIPGEIV